MTSPTSMTKEDLIAEVRSLMQGLHDNIIYGVFHRQEEFSHSLYDSYLGYVERNFPLAKDAITEHLTRYEASSPPAPPPQDPPPQDPPTEG